MAKVATVTASGAGNLTLGSIATGWDKLTSIDASAKTGNVSVTLGSTPADAGFSLKTGSGNDTVTVSGANTGAVTGTNGGLVTSTIDLGAGNDALVKSGSGAIIAGAAIDAGTGTDSVDLTLVTVGNAAIFKNFERLDVAGSSDGVSFDASVLTNSTISGVRVGGAIVDGADTGTDVGTVTVTNLSGTTVNVDVVANSAGTVKALLATATGAADTGNVSFSSFGVASSDQTVTLAGLATSGLETLNISSEGTVVNATSFDAVTVRNVLTNFEDLGNTVAAVNVTGGKGLTLGSVSVTLDNTTKAITAATFSADFITQNALVTTAPTANVQSKLTSIDGSAATGALYLYAGKSNDILVGSTNTDFDLVFDGLAIKGGAGADAIRNDAKAGSIAGGDGSDWLYVGGALGTASGGNGDDTLIAGSVIRLLAREQAERFE